MRVIPLWFSIFYVSLSSHSNARLRHSIFILCHQESYCFMIEFALIKIWFNIFMCFLLSTYFLVFLQEDFINCTVKNSFIFLLTVKCHLVFDIVPMVLSRPTFSIIRTKVSQDLAFIWWITGFIYETCGFGLTLKLVYIYISALASPITHIRVIIWWGRFSSL